MSNKRLFKHLLINKSFQIKFLAIFGTFIIAISASYAFAVYYSFMKFQTLGKQIGLRENHALFKFLNEQMNELFLIFGIAFLIVFVLFMYISLKLSHRVAGPLYRLNIHLKEISQQADKSNLRKVKFRKNDFFLELEESLNAFLDSIK